MYNYALLLHENLKKYDEAKTLLTSCLAQNPNPVLAECEALLARVNSRLSLAAQSRQVVDTLFGQAVILQQAKRYEEAAAKYADERVQFGAPIASKQLVQGKPAKVLQWWPKRCVLWQTVHVRLRSKFVI